MPWTASFRVTLDDGRFVGERAEDGPAPNDLQRRAFDAFLEVYNAMGKAQQWAEQTPWLTLRNDEAVMDQLAYDVHRTGNHPKLDLVRGGKLNEVAVTTFLSSRVFNLTRQKSDSNETESRSVLMPLIDFLNHDFRARGFQRVASEPWSDGSLYVFQDRPDPDTNECFVRYSLIDRHTSLLSYGFLDESAPFIISQPATLTLSQGLTVRVGRQIAKGFDDQLPDKMKDLQLYMPRVGGKPRERLDLSRLLIPGANAPRALRRVLAGVFQSKRQDWDQGTLEAAVREAEAKLLEANHRYFDRLAELVIAARERSDADDPPGRLRTLFAIEQLVTRQKRHLYDYIDRLAGG
jgi:hypothetical protein